MTVQTILILVLFCTGASFVQRVTGFGFGVFIMTILPYLMPSYGEATALSGLLALMQSLVVFMKMRNYLVWRKLVPILVTFVLVSFVAVKCVSLVDDRILKKVLGGVLIFASFYFLCVSERIHFRPTLPVQVGLGSLSGVMGGLFAMQGPPAVLYFFSAAKDKNEYIALTQAYFLMGNVMMTLFRAGEGFLTVDVGKAWCVALLAVFLGERLGAVVFNRISVVLLHKLSYAYMAVCGVIALVG